MRFRRSTFAILLCVQLVVIAAGATSAQAYTILETVGRPGTIDFKVVQGSHFNLCPGQPYTCFKPWIVGTGPTVYRSPDFTGDQIVAIEYRLFRWTGETWARQSTKTHFRTITAGYTGVRMPRIDFLPTRSGYFNIEIVVGYSSPRAPSVAIAGYHLDYNHARDYICNTIVGRCQVGTGWVFVS